MEENNGILASTGATTGTDTTTSPISTGTTHIGVRGSPVEKQFRGVMHKIIFYSVAQTQSQLEALVS